MNFTGAVPAARPSEAGPEADPACLPARERWEHFDHGADIGVRGYGPTPAAAFEQAALALTAVITGPDTVMARETVPIVCESDNDELLLVAWLNAIVSEMSARRMLFGRFHVDLQGGRLSATASGEPLSVRRHQPAVEVKGATYTALRVARTADGGWLAQTVVDV